MQTHSRAYQQSWRGRRRTYKCLQCGIKFQVDTVNAVPDNERICRECKANNENK